MSLQGSQLQGQGSSKKTSTASDTDGEHVSVPRTQLVAMSQAILDAETVSSQECIHKADRAQQLCNVQDSLEDGKTEISDILAGC